MKTVFTRAVPYGRDALHLPVRDVGSAIPYYERTLGFRVVTRESSPVNRAVLARDGIQIGLAENGGEPEQEGCFFEVDDVEAAYFESLSTSLQTQVKLYEGVTRRDLLDRVWRV